MNETKWNYVSIKHYINHIHFFRKQPLLLWRTIRGIFKTVVLKQKVVRSIELATTYNCNLRCDKCFAMKFIEGKKREYLTIPQIKDIWEQAYRMGAIHINLTGGEPLTRKDICEVIRVLKPKGTLISLVTNGILLTEEKARVLREAGLNTLQISLDSYKPELHDKYRGYKGGYKKVIRGVKIAKKAGLNVCFTTVATHENINTEEIPEMLKLSERMGVMLLINYAGQSGGWSGKKQILLTKEDRKVLNRYLKHPRARMCETFNFYLKHNICAMGKDKFNISAYGDVYPCTEVFLKFGDATKEPLKDIFERIRDFKYFQGFTHDCRRCDDEEFVKKYIEPIAKDKRPILDVNKDFKQR